MATIKGSGKSGCFPTFSIKTVQEIHDKFVEDVIDKQILALQRIGEEFVNKARTVRTYKDRTGNLRSSIGYSIYRDGKKLEGDFSGTKTGKIEAQDYADEISRLHPEGIVLIGVAGMNYARYVESKGYDVITGSEPQRVRIEEFLNAIE